MITLPKRRRQEGKTDYKSRKTLLKGAVPRLVFRKTTKGISGQIISSKESKDLVLITVISKKLISYGWPKEWEGSLKSLPAAYLTGYLTGKEAGKKKINKAILDIGLNRNVPKSRIYAFVKGAVDAGLNTPTKEKMFPSEDRVFGMHMKKDVKKIMDEILNKINTTK